MPQATSVEKDNYPATELEGRLQDAIEQASKPPKYRGPGIFEILKNSLPIFFAVGKKQAR